MTQAEKQRVIDKFNKGMLEWRQWCRLMDKHPNASYCELLLRQSLMRIDNGGQDIPAGYEDG